MTDVYYVLKGKRVYKEPDLLKWAEFIENMRNRQVSLTILDDIFISTVFLGLDHNFGSGRPLLFETMVFKNKESHDTFNGRPYSYHESLDEFTQRYPTYGLAQKGHQKIVTLLKNRT